MPDLLTLPQASTFARSVDVMTLVLVGISLFFTLLVSGLIAVFAFRYHHKKRADRSNPTTLSLKLEIFWTVVPLLITLGIFSWTGKLFMTMRAAPDQAMPIYVVGKQWMWKFQHPQGRRENNELHVPVGRPIKLIMTSQDVIHSLFVPAFRVKQDVVPGKYTTVWFTATEPGDYHLFCSQYCGTSHSGMVGRVVAMPPKDFDVWLGGAGEGGASMAKAGEKLFSQYACASCHRPNSPGRGPALNGIYKRSVRLADGRTVVADEKYLRESILRPQAQVVAGYEPLMPTFQNVINEEGILDLIAYIKSLGDAGSGAAP